MSLWDIRSLKFLIFLFEIFFLQVRYLATNYSYIKMFKCNISKRIKFHSILDRTVQRR